MTWHKFIRIMAGLGLFAIAYALINSELLIHSILYRLAANDSNSAIFAAISISIQSLITLVLVICLPKRFFWVMLAIVWISAAINLTYSGILGEIVDRSKVAWMLVEVRQSTNAAGQFADAFAIAAFKTVLAIILLLAVRYFLRPFILPLLNRVKVSKLIAMAMSMIALAGYAVLPLALSGAVASERNAFVYAAQIWMAAPPPDRAEVPIEPVQDGQIEKIIWLIDESISQEVFESAIKPDLSDKRFTDFGGALALGNCSTPANFALRAGVNVSAVNSDTDLRTTPSIWGYAQKAGYQTMLIDGQVSGPPQNLLLSPERKLIDLYDSAADGLDTDRKLARRLNKMMKKPGRKFAYVVLRGVHFQYTGHYPGGAADTDLPVDEQYEKAVRYSKKDFFNRLLDGVDRERVAIIYTADHGQNMVDGAMPHCSVNPTAAEFSVPLIAFLPPTVAEYFSKQKDDMRSASQIFPTTLQWMGYPAQYAEKKYDNDLTKASKRAVWFGRTVVPVDVGDKIEVYPVPER